ncbi:HDOD domain-containing protein [bacterium]|nr:HDOD domain-containing protein [bacterium]
MAIDLFDFYKRCLIPLTPHPAVTKILNYIMAGGETTEDYAEVLQLDHELQRWARLTVQRRGRKTKNLEQIVLILGQDRVRNMLIGRAIERAFVPAGESLPELALANPPPLPELDKDDDDKGEGPSEESEKETSEDKKKNEKKAKAEEQEDNDEIIPDVTEYKKYLEFANRSEKIAVAIRNSYPGQAFAGGVIFDYIRYFLKAQDLSSLHDPKLTNIDAFVNNIFEDGARCGIAANAIMKVITIKHQKTIFTSALLHNIGKALLLAYDPKNFEAAFLVSTGSKDSGSRIDSVDAEMAQFDFDHAQAGALFFRRISFFEDIEPAIDFHHHPGILRFSSPAHYALSCALRVSGALVKLYQRRRNDDPNPLNILDDKLKKSEVFQSLKLRDKEWDKIRMEYANNLNAAQL